MSYKLWRGQNAKTCKICALPGELLLCSFCPVSVHPACVNIAHIPSGDYRCQDCNAALGPGLTDPAAQDPTGTCAKSTTCSRTDRHIGRCNHGLTPAATSTIALSSNTTTTAEVPRLRRLAAIQQQHTADTPFTAEDQRFHDMDMTHAERRAMLRTSELIWRRKPDDHTRRLDKVQRTAQYHDQAAARALRRTQQRGVRAVTPRRERIRDSISEAAEPVAHHAWTAPDHAEHTVHTPAWLSRIGSLSVPINGTDEGVWVYHAQTAASLPVHARDVPVPQNYNAARASTHWIPWQQAIHAELKQLQDKGVFSVVDRAEARGQVVLGMTWSFKVKDVFDDADTWTGIKFKARLNVRGDQQKDEHINPDHRSSPTADIDSLRLLLATTAGTPGAEFLKFDVICAFINAKRDPTAPRIYMHAPQGLQLPSGQMLLLDTNIYGLVEAAYYWFMEFSGTLKTLGWNQGITDPCIFHWPSSTSPARLILHVDDGMIGGKQVEERYMEIAKKYDMKNLGKQPTTFLGMELYHHDDGRILLHNNNYIQHLLQHWATHPDHPIDVRHARETKRVPINPKANLNIPTASVLTAAPWYSEFVGQTTSLNKTRADILVATTQLAQGIKRQTPAHHMACRDLLIYLRDTADLGVAYGQMPGADISIDGYGDAEFGGNRSTGRALGGYSIMVKGGLVSLKAHEQGGVTRSSNEAETITFTDTAAAAIKIKHYLADMGMTLARSPLIHVDNANVIKSCQNVALTTAARHYAQAYHWGRQLYREGKIRLQQVRSQDNMADIFTKPLHRGKHEQHRGAFGMTTRAALRGISVTDAVAVSATQMIPVGI